MLENVDAVSMIQCFTRNRQFHFFRLPSLTDASAGHDLLVTCDPEVAVASTHGGSSYESGQHLQHLAVLDRMLCHISSL